ncbi:MAG: hypothetical protein L3J58_05760, partial [Emcibacter sp.]|nr:hypothetical protein [Emcibacter sp.]
LLKSTGDGEFPIPCETETGSINDNRIHLNFAAKLCRQSGPLHRTIIVPPRYTTDTAYARDLDISNIDNVIDEMMVEIGADTYTDTVEQRTNFNYIRLQDSVTGTHGGGYSYLYTDERMTTDQYFGRLYLDQDISGIIASSIDFTQNILNWSMRAPTGQFQAQRISLQLSFNQASAIPEPDMAFLFGAGFIYLGWRLRRK